MGTVVGVTASKFQALEAQVAAMGGGDGPDFLSFNAPVDGVDSVVLVSEQGRDVNGFVFKANALAENEYGQGQAFLVLEEGVGDADDDTATGSVMFRVDRHGNIGTTGGLHVATGLRNNDGQLQAVWIDPSDDMIPLVINNPSMAEAGTWVSDYIRVVDTRNANEVVFKVMSTGAVHSTKEFVARDGGATRVAIGDTFGFAGVALGAAADTLLFRAQAGMIGVANAFEFTEMASPGVAAANKVRLFSRDNGAGKTQLVCIFSSGAIQVLATQP